MYVPSEHLKQCQTNQLTAHANMEEARERYVYLCAIGAAFALWPIMQCWNIIAAMVG